MPPSAVNACNVQSARLPTSTAPAPWTARDNYLYLPAQRRLMPMCKIPKYLAHRHDLLNFAAQNCLDRVIPLRALAHSSCQNLLSFDKVKAQTFLARIHSKRHISACDE